MGPFHGAHRGREAATERAAVHTASDDPGGVTLESAFKFQTLARDREHTQELPGAAPRH